MRASFLSPVFLPSRARGFTSLDKVERRLLLWWQRTDRAMLRRAHAWRTRKQAYHAAESCYTPEGHEAFYRTARSAAAEAVRGGSPARGRRRAERGAIFAALERFELIRRTRSGVPLEASKATD